MGQGYYNAIGFGCLETKALSKRFSDDFDKDGTLGDDFYDLVSEHDGHTSYESKTPYIAIFLADSGRDNATMAPTSTFEDFEKAARALVTPRVRAKWERLRKKAKRKFGIDLPEGRLLFIADYD